MILLYGAGLLSLRQVNFIVPSFCLFHNPCQRCKEIQGNEKRAEPKFSRAPIKCTNEALQQPLQPYCLAVHRRDQDDRRLLRVLDHAGQLILLR